jgi:hypothetical protein
MQSMQLECRPDNEMRVACQDRCCATPTRGRKSRHPWYLVSHQLKTTQCHKHGQHSQRHGVWEHCASLEECQTIQPPICPLLQGDINSPANRRGGTTELVRLKRADSLLHRTFRDRKEAYVGALEQGLLGMREGSDRIIKERDALADENERLKSVFTAHGIGFDLDGPADTGNEKESKALIPQSLFSFSRQRLLKTSCAAKSKLRVRSYVQYRTANLSATKGKDAAQVGGTIVNPHTRTSEGRSASFSAESSFANIEQRRCLDNLV